MPPTTTLVKSLPEIQAEKAAQIALLREKEAKERANQQAQFNLAFAGAWGASHGSISGSGGFVWGPGRIAASIVAQHTQFQSQPPPPAQQQTVNHSNNL